MILFLIRHGQSTNNALGADQSGRHYDAPLTELGKQQVEHLAQWLATHSDLEWATSLHEHMWTPFKFTRLYCSPMRRALQTAQPIARALGLRPEVWVELYEHGGVYLDQGERKVAYPGMNRTEILAEFEGYALPEAVTDAGWWSGVYEELEACEERACRVAETLVQWAESDERIALVTHGTFGDRLLKALFGQPLGRRPFYIHANTGMTRVEFAPETLTGVFVRYVNRIEHLPPEMVTV